MARQRDILTSTNRPPEANDEWAVFAPLKREQLRQGLIPHELVEWVRACWKDGRLLPLPEGYTPGYKYDALALPTRTITIRGEEINFRLPAGIGTIPGVLHIGGLFGTIPNSYPLPPNLKIAPVETDTPQDLPFYWIRPQRRLPVSAVTPIMGITSVGNDGSTRSGPDRTPLGGYTLENARRKYRNTLKVAKALEKARSVRAIPPSILVPEMVGILAEETTRPLPPEERLAVLLSIEPLTTIPVETYLRTINPFAPEGREKLKNFYYELGAFFGVLHFLFGVVHTQPHRGNIAILKASAPSQPDFSAIVVRDWETMHYLLKGPISPSALRKYLVHALKLEFHAIIGHLIIPAFLPSLSAHHLNQTQPNAKEIRTSLLVALEGLARGYSESSKYLIPQHIRASLTDRSLEEVRKRVDSSQIENELLATLSVIERYKRGKVSNQQVVVSIARLQNLQEVVNLIVPFIAYALNVITDAGIYNPTALAALKKGDIESLLRQPTWGSASPPRGKPRKKPKPAQKHRKRKKRRGRKNSLRN